jgi:hypothetical protein
MLVLTSVPLPLSVTFPPSRLTGALLLIRLDVSGPPELSVAVPPAADTGMLVLTSVPLPVSVAFPPSRLTGALMLVSVEPDVAGGVAVPLPLSPDPGFAAGPPVPTVPVAETAVPVEGAVSPGLPVPAEVPPEPPPDPGPVTVAPVAVVVLDVPGILPGEGSVPVPVPVARPTGPPLTLDPAPELALACPVTATCPQRLAVAPVGVAAPAVKASPARVAPRAITVACRAR